MCTGRYKLFKHYLWYGFMQIYFILFCGAEYCAHVLVDTRQILNPLAPSPSPLKYGIS
jgi:hypothetical protein